MGQQQRGVRLRAGCAAEICGQPKAAYAERSTEQGGSDMNKDQRKSGRCMSL